MVYPRPYMQTNGLNGAICNKHTTCKTQFRTHMERVGEIPPERKTDRDVHLLTEQIRQRWNKSLGLKKHITFLKLIKSCVFNKNGNQNQHSHAKHDCWYRRDWVSTHGDPFVWFLLMFDFFPTLWLDGLHWLNGLDRLNGLQWLDGLN